MSTSNTGNNISNLPNALINRLNWKGKLQYPHYFMSYAEVNYGFGTINKNYKVSVGALREDFKGFIGVENAKGQWRHLSRFWVGDWYKEKEVDGVTVGDKVNSYLYHWNSRDIGNDDYIVNKFGTETVAAELPTDRVFFVRNAPIPCEYNYATLFTEPVVDEYGNFERDENNEIKFRTLTYVNDPHPDLMKIVDKNYVDNRFNGIRLIDVTNTVVSIQGYNVEPIQAITVAESDIDTSVRDYPIIAQFKSKLQIRPYPCVYEYNFQEGAGIDDVDVIDIWDNLDCGTGKTTKELIKNNTLTFFIKLPKTKYKDGQKKGEKGIILTTNGKFTGRQFNFPQTDENGEVILDKDGKQVMVNAFEHYYSPLVKWSFLGERHEIFDNAYEAQRNVLIKVQCHYEGDDLHLVCSNAFNYEPGTSNMDAITRYISNSISDQGGNKVPSSNLFFDHIFGTDVDGYVEATDKHYNESVNAIHVSKQDRESWEGHVNDVTNSAIYSSNDVKSQHHFTQNEKQKWWELLDHKVHDITIDAADKELVKLTVDNGSTESNISHRIFTFNFETCDALTEARPTRSIVTSDALWEHAFDDDGTFPVKHTNEKEKSAWNSKLDNVKGDEFIKIDKPTALNEDSGKVETTLKLNTISNIEQTTPDENDKTVPTTGAVKKHVAKHSGIYYSDEMVKCGNFRFLGAHVHTIVEQDENGDPRVKLYFGPNNNPPYAATIDGIGGSTYYLYKSATNSYILPKNFSYDSSIGDKTYSHIYSTRPSNIKLKINNGELITVPVDISGETTKKVEAIIYKHSYDKDGNRILESVNHVYCSLPVVKDTDEKYAFDIDSIVDGNYDKIERIEIFNEETEERTFKYSVKSEIYKGLQLELSNIYINQTDDAEAGFIPGYAQLNAQININTFDDYSSNSAMDETGSYSVSFIVDGEEITTKEDFFIFGSEGSYIAPEIKVDYVAGLTKWISGIAYDSSATMTINVSGIKNTQQQITKDLNRLNLTLTNTETTTTTNVESVIKKSNSKLEITKNTDTLSNGAEYSYNSEHAITTSTDVGKFNKTVTAKLYDRENSIVAKSSAEDGAAPDSWLWTHTKDTQNAYTITFNNDGTTVSNGNVDKTWLRELGAWDVINKRLFTNKLGEKKFNSELSDCLNSSPTSETKDYYNELLVQGCWLRHPKHDKTGTYSGQTNERCFVRRIQMPKINGESSHKQLGEFNIKINNFNSKHIISGGSSKVANTNVYLATKETNSEGINRVMHLNSERNETTSSDTVASVYKAGSFSNSSWTVDCKSDVFSLYTDTDYYLIVTMTTESEDLGTITISRVK